MKAIGIDFGTTNSVAAEFTSAGPKVITIDSPPADWASLGFDKVLPSVAALDEQRNLLFGWEAKRLTTSRKCQAIKRLFQREEIATIGDEEFFVEEVAAAIFRHIRNRVISNGIDFTSAVITVPANSRGLARYRTRVCAGMAGIAPLALLNEPTAAAMAYSRRHMADAQNILVFDFGGGTLDCTILDTREGMFFEQSSKGVQRLGGIDFDNAILSAIADEVPGAERWTPTDRERIRLEVEKAKIRLSNSDTDETVIVDQALPGYRLTRPRFNELTAHLVERSREPIMRTLGDLHMTPSDIDQLLLVGGTSKLPAVRNFVAELIGKEPATGVDPMTAVAEGAAVAAAILSGDLEDSGFFVSTEHALGTVAVDPVARRLVFAPVIPRNQKLPAKQTETFFPLSDYQESVHVSVIEGDPDAELDSDQNQILTEFDVPLDPPRLMSEAGFDLTFHYDSDGLLQIDAVDSQTGRALTDQVSVSFKGARSGRDLVTMAANAESMADEGVIPEKRSRAEALRTDPRSRDLVTKARTKVIPFLEESDASQMIALVEALENATDDALATAQEELEAALMKYSYLL